MSFYIVDKDSRVGLISIEPTLIFTKVSIEQIDHNQSHITTCDAIIQKYSLLAIGNQNIVMVYKIKPIQMICSITI